MAIWYNRWNNQQFVFITAPDKPTPFVVICDHPTRRTIPVCHPPYLGSAWGDATATAANWGNGVVCTADPAGGFFATRPQWPTVNGTLKALHYDLFLTETEADPNDPLQAIETQVHIPRPPAAPTTALGNPVGGLGIVRFRLDPQEDWCVGWCWGRSSRSNANYGMYPSNHMLDETRLQFISDATEIIEFYQSVGQPDPDFLVVEARVHQDVRYGMPITVRESAGLAGFTFGTVKFDGSGATGLADACDFIDAGYEP